MIDVSILMGVYNRETLVIPTIESILNQTYEDFLFIICDDGSTDNTWKVLSSYAKKDSRIILLQNKENKGIPITTNRLLDACETKYATWQGSDDLSNIHRIEFELNAIKKYSKMIGTKGIRIRGMSEYNYHELPVDKCSGSLINGSLFFPVDKKIRYPEDRTWHGMDSIWRDLMKEKYDVYCIDKILYYVRFHRNRIGYMKNIYKSLPAHIRSGMSYADVLNYMNEK